VAILAENRGEIRAWRRTRWLVGGAENPDIPPFGKGL